MFSAPPRSGKVSAAARRATMRRLLAVVNSTTKDLPEITDSYKRAQAIPNPAFGPDRVNIAEPAR
jgi:hypothetical protein